MLEFRNFNNAAVKAEKINAKKNKKVAEKHTALLHETLSN